MRAKRRMTAKTVSFLNSHEAGPNGKPRRKRGSNEKEAMLYMLQMGRA